MKTSLELGWELNSELLLLYSCKRNVTYKFRYFPDIYFIVKSRGIVKVM